MKLTRKRIRTVKPKQKISKNVIAEDFSGLWKFR